MLTINTVPLVGSGDGKAAYPRLDGGTAKGNYSVQAVDAFTEAMSDINGNGTQEMAQAPVWNGAPQVPVMPGQQQVVTVTPENAAGAQQDLQVPVAQPQHGMPASETPVVQPQVAIVASETMVVSQPDVLGQTALAQTTEQVQIAVNPQPLAAAPETTVAVQPQPSEPSPETTVAAQPHTLAAAPETTVVAQPQTSAPAPETTVAAQPQPSEPAPETTVAVEQPALKQTTVQMPLEQPQTLVPTTEAPVAPQPVVVEQAVLVQTTGTAPVVQPQYLVPTTEAPVAPQPVVVEQTVIVQTTGTAPVVQPQTVAPAPEAPVLVEQTVLVQVPVVQQQVVAAGQEAGTFEFAGETETVEGDLQEDGEIALTVAMPRKDEKREAKAAADAITASGMAAGVPVAAQENAAASSVQEVQAVSARTTEIVERVERVLTASEVFTEAATAVAETILVNPSLLRSREGEIAVQLKDSVLDGSQLKIAVVGNSMTVNFVPSTMDVSRYLEQSLPQLTQHLAQHINSYQVAVVISSDNQKSRWMSRK